MRLQPCAQADEHVAGKERLLHQLQRAPTQLFCTDQRQKTLKALALEVFQGKALIGISASTVTAAIAKHQPTRIQITENISTHTNSYDHVKVSPHAWTNAG